VETGKVDRAQRLPRGRTTKMTAHCSPSGKSINKVIDWVASEIEGFTRM
jgi:hypothetical protein